MRSELDITPELSLCFGSLASTMLILLSLSAGQAFFLLSACNDTSRRWESQGFYAGLQAGLDFM